MGSVRSGESRRKPTFIPSSNPMGGTVDTPVTNRRRSPIDGSSLEEDSGVGIKYRRKLSLLVVHMNVN